MYICIFRAKNGNAHPTWKCVQDSYRSEATQCSISRVFSPPVQRRIGGLRSKWKATLSKLHFAVTSVETSFPDWRKRWELVPLQYEMEVVERQSMALVSSQSAVQIPHLRVLVLAWVSQPRDWRNSFPALDWRTSRGAREETEAPLRLTLMCCPSWQPLFRLEENIRHNHASCRGYLCGGLHWCVDWQTGCNGACAWTHEGSVAEKNGLIVRKIANSAMMVVPHVTVEPDFHRIIGDMCDPLGLLAIREQYTHVETRTGHLNFGFDNTEKHIYLTLTG